MIEPIHTEHLDLVPIDGVPAAESLAQGDLGELGDLVAGAGWPRSAQTDGALAHVIRSGVADLWLIVLAGEVVGHVFLKGGTGPDGRAEIGYGLAQKYRGRGYATEAVIGLVEWATGGPAVTALVAATLSDNTASRAVLERAGFAITHSQDGFVYWLRETVS